MGSSIGNSSASSLIQKAYQFLWKSSLRKSSDTFRLLNPFSAKNKKNKKRIFFCWYFVKRPIFCTYLHFIVRSAYNQGIILLFSTYVLSGGKYYFFGLLSSSNFAHSISLTLQGRTVPSSSVDCKLIFPYRGLCSVITECPQLCSILRTILCFPSTTLRRTYE
jgi:hypothetical protein